MTLEPRDETVVAVVEYDPAWPSQFEAVAAEVRAALAPDAPDVVHIGSTAVPGLAAKPVIDVAVVTADPSDEGAYAPLLEEIGYVLVVREPEWYGHRMFQRAGPQTNLHIYPRGCEEVERVVRFRDWLRSHDDDRERYAAAKRTLAEQAWGSVQDYADAKNDIVADIMRRAMR